VRGEHDWVANAEDQARIAGLVAGASQVIDLPGLDHVMGRHDSREASVRDYGAGPLDASIIKATIEWLEKL
jgi:hypothetical protein